MKKIFATISLVMCCVCSRAETNTVESVLSDIQSSTESIQSSLSNIESELGGSNFAGMSLSEILVYMWSDIGIIQNYLPYLQDIDDIESIVSAMHVTDLPRLHDDLVRIRSDLVNANQYLSGISTMTNDVASIYRVLQTVGTNVASCKSSLLALVQYVFDIRNYCKSLPQIEEYQSALSVIVSNINEHILSGVNVTIPNTINVNVQNPLNFNPEWDFLSRSFQWGGWSFDNTWQQFATPDSTDNTLQGAAPMSVPATTTLAEYLERLYVGINNSGRILNDSIIHACYLLEGSNTVSQADQEEVSESVDSSVSNAPTKMEEVSSSIPTPSFGVNTSYIRRGLGFWDHVYNIQKPTSIILRTSPSDGDLISVPEIYIEIKLSDYPALDKLLEFCRAVFTWLWWFLSVFFLVWLFKRGFALYTMVMGMLGPKPVQTNASDVI